LGRRIFLNKQVVGQSLVLADLVHQEVASIRLCKEKYTIIYLTALNVFSYQRNFINKCGGRETGMDKQEKLTCQYLCIL